MEKITKLDPWQNHVIKKCLLQVKNLKLKNKICKIFNLWFLISVKNLLYDLRDFFDEPKHNKSKVCKNDHPLFSFEQKNGLPYKHIYIIKYKYAAPYRIFLPEYFQAR